MLSTINKWKKIPLFCQDDVCMYTNLQIPNVERGLCICLCEVFVPARQFANLNLFYKKLCSIYKAGLMCLCMCVCVCRSRIRCFSLQQTQLLDHMYPHVSRTGWLSCLQCSQLLLSLCKQQRYSTLNQRADTHHLLFLAKLFI
jgi:hypothetical protein